VAMRCVIVSINHYLSIYLEYSFAHETLVKEKITCIQSPKAKNARYYKWFMSLSVLSLLAFLLILYVHSGKTVTHGYK